jgi:hypothetical protein
LSGRDGAEQAEGDDGGAAAAQRWWLESNERGSDHV